MPKTRAADVLAASLAAAGATRAYGMPGGEVLTLIDALDRAGIAFHLARHETAAGFMAEGAWHASGGADLPILVATVGPGLMNAVNVVANAEQDRVPLIVLAGCVDADEALSYTHQVLDQRAVLGPITRATFTLSPGGAAAIAAKAVRAARGPRAGPVLIDVPISVADAPAAASSPRFRHPAPMVPAGADMARAWLGGAERPLMIAGLDLLEELDPADPSRPHPAIHVARQFGIPVITTYKAKGVIPEDDPLCLGGAGLSPLADRHLMPLVAAADLILLAGYDPVEMRTGWRRPWSLGDQRVIDVGHAFNTHDMHDAMLNIVGAVGDTMRAISHGVTPRSTWPDGEPAAARAALAQAFPADGDWGPGAIVDEVRAALPDTAIVTVDSGAHRILLAQQWICRQPRTLLQSTGLCTMGCALPLAIGAKQRAPDRRVVAVTGDAGLLMCLGEVATAVEAGLALTVVVVVDASLALIEKKQRARQMPNLGVDFDAPDFAALARAFGGRGHEVFDRDAMRAGLAAADGFDGVTIIAARIDRGAYDGRI